MSLVVGPEIIAVLVPALPLILIAELPAKQSARIVRDATQPLLHRLLLFLGTPHGFRFCFAYTLFFLRFGGLLHRLLRGALQFLLHRLEIFLARAFLVAYR